MKTIRLTQGQVALVDDADYEWLSKWRWRAQWNRNSKTFYASRHLRMPNGARRTIQMHRLILGLTTGDPRESDHINHCGLDNTNANLRVVTSQENDFNRRAKGYSLDRKTGKYQVYIGLNRKNKFLGRYDSPTEARAAYLAAKAVYHKIGVCT